MLKWNVPTIMNKPAHMRDSYRDALKEPEGNISDPEMFSNHASLKILAKDCMTKLQQHYPGWHWAIQINQFGGMLNIFCLDLHDTWAYTIRIIEVEHDPTRRRFLMAGGEVLERFGFRRGPVDWEKLAAMPRDLKGRGFPILSDLENASAKRARRKQKLDKAIAQAMLSGQYFFGADGRVNVGVIE